MTLDWLFWQRDYINFNNYIDVMLLCFNNDDAFFLVLGARPFYDSINNVN